MRPHNLFLRVVLRVITLALIVAIVFSTANITLPLHAQSAQIDISVAIPAAERDLFNDNLIQAFQADHPNVRVNVVLADTPFPPAIKGLDQHLASIEQYVTSADVLYVDPARISPEATLAGYFLDLKPLVDTDKTLNISDFFPTIWQSYQWNNGTWALPIGANVMVLTYIPAAFDKVGLAYPDDKWTLSDLDHAARTLSQKDSSGGVLIPGIDVLPDRQRYILRDLLSTGLFDSSVVPNTPQIATDEAATLLGVWGKLDQDGLIGQNNARASMNIGNTLELAIQVASDPTQKRVGVLLPGGKAGLETQGFAVSAGTQNPELAYALASFLTTRPEFAGRFVSTSARMSLSNISSNNALIQVKMPPEVQKLISQGIDNGIPFAETRYADYLDLALQKMKTDRTDSLSALQNVESTALTAQKSALNKKSTLSLMVAPPPLTGNASNGKVALKFGLGMSVDATKDRWTQVVQQFTSSDPQVGSITFNMGFDSLDKESQKNDCFYLPTNIVPSANVGYLSNLDPLMAADSTFDKSDVIGTALAQLQRDNKTWGFPIAIDPAVLTFDSARFSKAGLAMPKPDWLVNEFVDDLKVLKPTPSDPSPFKAANEGGNHLLILIAAYGGIPLDYRTNPPTINYTDPATVNAIRQVLDLAKQGYIGYDALGNLNFGFGPQDRTVAVYPDSLSAFGTHPDPNSPYKLINYPKGTQYAGVSYTIGAGYISATTQNPEACYRWISTIAGHPELFASMPARHSQIKDPALAAVQGPDVIALYNNFDALIQAPNTISLPSVYSSGESLIGFVLQYWLFQVFDNYVLKNGDLESLLKNAEFNAKSFQQCTVSLPPLDESTSASALVYYKALSACAAKVDPTLGALISLMPH